MRERLKAGKLRVGPALRRGRRADGRPRFGSERSDRALGEHTEKRGARDAVGDRPGDARERRIEITLAQLETHLQDDETAVWTEFREVAVALSAILPNIAPGRNGELLTTAQMAEKLGISSKTLLKRRRAGKVQPALQLGRRGVAALRWSGSEVPR